MMNKSEHLRTMYEAVPVVAGMNRVEGFEPLDLLGCAASPAEGGERPEFGLAYKKLWFRLANPKGRIQTEKISLTESEAVFEARIYLDCGDENPVSSFISCSTRQEAPGGRYIQAAQDGAVDQALADAGFGIQFACVSADYCGAEGNRTVLSDDECGVGREKNGAGSGAAGAVHPAPNTGQSGKAAMSFSGEVAGREIKAAPGQGVQPAGNAGTVRPAVGQVQPQVGSAEPVQNAGIQRQAESAGNIRPVQGIGIQGQNVAGNIRPMQTGAVQRQNAAAGNVRPVQAGAVQRQNATAGNVRPMQAGATQRQNVTAAGNVRPMQAGAVQRQNATAVGGARVIQGGAVQRQNAAMGNVRPVQAGFNQEQNAVSAGNDGLVQASLSPGTAQSPGPAMRPMQAVQAGEGGPIQAFGVQNQSGQSTGASKPAQGAVHQEQNAQPGGNQADVRSAMAQVQPEQRPAAVTQGAHPAAGELPDQLPIPPASTGGMEGMRSTAQKETGKEDRLPVPHAGETGQNAQAARATADKLPVPPRDNSGGKTQESVQKAMNLLGGQMPPTDAEGNSAGSMAVNRTGSKGTNPAEGTAGDKGRNTAKGIVGDDRNIAKGTAEDISPNATGASPQETGSQQPQPESAGTQEDSGSRFTPDMPVEEILAGMTLEEAGRVVVDTGVCKGQTLAEVAQRRPPSLKFYRYGGYKGDNNILRAAAQIMLDSMEAKKAG